MVNILVGPSLFAPVFSYNKALEDDITSDKERVKASARENLAKEEVDENVLAVHNFLGMTMPTFSNKPPRIGLSKLERVTPLHQEQQQHTMAKRPRREE